MDAALVSSPVLIVLWRSWASLTIQRNTGHTTQGRNRWSDHFIRKGTIHSTRGKTLLGTNLRVSNIEFGLDEAYLLTLLRVRRCHSKTQRQGWTSDQIKFGRDRRRKSRFFLVTEERFPLSNCVPVLPALPDKYLAKITTAVDRHAYRR